MQYIQTKMPDDFNLFMFGDDHCGNRFRYDEGFGVLKNMLGSSWNGLPASRNFGCHSGDIGEMTFVDDYRYSADAAPENPKEGNILAQMKKVQKEYKDIAHRLVFILGGNHDTRREYEAFGDITAGICENLKVPYGTYSARIAYRAKRGDALMFRQFAGHGWGSVKSMVRPYRRARVNMEISLKQKLENKASNCLLMTMGHTHKLLCYRPENRLILVGEDTRVMARWTGHEEFHGEQEHIPEEQRFYVNTGSLLRLYDKPGSNSYGEKAGYDPIEMGFAICEVRDRKIKDVKLIAIDDEYQYKIIN